MKTVLRQLRGRGLRLAGGPTRMLLPLTDAQLRQRLDAGATIAELARLCRASPATIWRHLQLGAGQRDRRRTGPITDTILDHLAAHPDLACTIEDLVAVVYPGPAAGQQ